MLLKRQAPRGVGGALGSMHPIAIARRPSRFLPVVALVVVMFFVAVYR